MRAVDATISSDPVRRYLLSLQDSICRALEAEDGEGAFREDASTRREFLAMIRND